MPSSNLLNWLKLPEASDLSDLDNPENIHALKRIIQQKTFLRNTYKDFYHKLLSRIRKLSASEEIVELGSGAGFIKTIAPHVVTSDILPYSGIDRVFSALDMPMQSGSVGAFLMIDVLHHVKDSRLFFQEMQRCLRIGGKIVMIEPANTMLSRIIYKNFHHEPFDTRGGWGFEEGGPLSGANMAIPWIIFERDRTQFIKEFPNLKLCYTDIHTPLLYLLSGGLSLRQLLPSWLYPYVKTLEWMLSPLNRYLGMFVTIELEKTGEFQ